MDAIREFQAKKINGFLALLVIILLWAAAAWILVDLIQNNQPVLLWVDIPLMIVAALLLGGLYVVQPNEARVLVFFGRYIGSVRESGFWYSNPFAIKRHVSLRIRNFNSERLKVNDLQGNPIEIAAVIVWRVVDSAKALFDVENYEGFVAIQSETAIRAMTSHYPYDAHVEGQPSLRGNPGEVSDSLRGQVQARLEVAGVEIQEARISHLAYAQEIAQAMLRRQQAEAIVAARQKIVEGAVGMVESALKMLSEQGVIELDHERKAAMINNLLVALVSEHEASPVINAGSLY
ncbi:MAG TPA: SPFH domain-containing protein [Bacteroidota bacterium]|nr:SPFH domain-containing protein [Bacteroidota bacterium]